MAKYIDNTNLGYLISKIKAAFWPKADVTNVTLADVAVTGDYDDLTNKPTIPGPEVFWAEYGVTTAAEVAAAMAAGKAVMVAVNSRVFRLESAINGQYYFVASAGDYIYNIELANSWGSVQTKGIELTSRKVTSWQATPSDSKYPSEKLVKDSLDAKVNSVSLATVATSGDYSDLTNIPSASIIGEEISPASQELPAVMQLEDSSGTAIEPYCPGLEEWIEEKANLNGDTTQNFRVKSLRFRENPMTGQYSAISYNTTIKRPTLTDSFTTIIAEPIALQDDIPTISTNIVSDKAINAKTASPKAVYDEIHPTTGSAQPSGGFLPNILYSLGTLSGNTTFALATPADANVVNHYYWTFNTSTTAPTITWPSGLTWMGGSAPTINASKHYEISVLNSIAVAMEV